jgi:hypothetical protein
VEKTQQLRISRTTVNTDIQKKTPPKQGFVTTRDTITGRNQATKQKQTEEYVDVFHSQHPTKTVNLSEGNDGIS